MKVWYLAQRGRAGELEKLLARAVKGGAHRSEGTWNLSLQHFCWTLKVYDLEHPSNWCYPFIHMATTLEVLQLPNWKNWTQGTCCLSLFYLVSSSYYLNWLSFSPHLPIAPLLPVLHQMLPSLQRNRKGLKAVHTVCTSALVKSVQACLTQLMHQQARGPALHCPTHHPCFFWSTEWMDYEQTWNHPR